MAPKKKGPRKPYERFKYADQNMEEAVKAVKGGMTLCSAASMYSVPKSTLHNRCSGKIPDPCKMGPKSILTEAEEDRMEKWILDKAQVGFIMHPDEVKDAVQRIMEEVPRKNPFINNRPGDKWMGLFLKRHPKIFNNHKDIVLKSRACITEKGLREWFDNLRTFLEENNNLEILDRPRSIFNGDEMGVQTCPKSSVLLGAKTEKSYYEIANGAAEKECITVLCTFSATGEAIPPMIIFPYKRIPVHIAQSVPDKWTICRSDSGWILQATFYEYVAKVFYPWCVNNNVQFPVLYFLDGHKFYISSELLEFCAKHAIILYCLPPKSISIMQPCDIAIFKPLKVHWKDVLNEYKQQTQKAAKKSNFALLFKTALDRLQVKLESIQNGFKACGLYPFDENAIDYSKCISSTGKAKFHQEPENSSITIEDFASTKKVIEHFIGSVTATSCANMKFSNRLENAIDPLFTLWRICTDHIEGTHIPNDEESIPDTVIETQHTETF